MAVTIMDIVTALLILSDPNRLVVARLGIFYQLFPTGTFGAMLMLLAAAMAVMGLSARYSISRFLLFIPQQFFLLMTTGSAIDYVVQQHYADGVARPWQFILQDQLPTIVLTLGYFFAVRAVMRR